MDSTSLRTASKYLNNLLLARGLLRNGAAIDFVRPSKDSRAQIINLVHDLVLRSDREKEQREKIATAYRQLRSSHDDKIQEIERLKAKQDEATRAAVQAQTTERAAREELKRIEKTARTLQEQIGKLKIANSQIKSQCITDIKKRDLELARLKTHLQGQQRGNRSVTIAPSITVTARDQKPVFDASIHNVQSPEYTLRQETNAFLTKLSQGLSEENERLLSLVRDTLERLQDLLGYKNDLQKASDSGIGDDTATPRHFNGQQDAAEQLSSQMIETLTHLKELLTNPNFVSIEEVEVREEEILRMRADWDKMEQRWKNLLKMMDGWKQRMNTGGNIDMNDLKKGMGLVSPDSNHTTILAPARPYEECSIFDESMDSIVEEPATISKHGDGRAAAAHVSGSSSPKRKRDPLEPPESFDLRPRDHRHKAVKQTSNADHSRELFEVARRSNWPAELDDSDNESEELEIPRMTVDEKLSAVAQEAAAVRELDHADEDARDHDTLGKMPTQIKKTRITGRPKRRKSTLSRDELAELLQSEE